MQQLELGFLSMRAQGLPRPISQLNSYLLDFDFFFYLLVVGNSSTEEFKLYKPAETLTSIVYWLFLLCAVYRLLRLLIEFAFGSLLLEVGASFSWKATERIITVWLKSFCNCRERTGIVVRRLEALGMLYFLAYIGRDLP